MMGHRDRLINGDEMDAVTCWRKMYRFKPGRRKAIKRRINKRARRKKEKDDD